MTIVCKNDIFGISSYFDNCDIEHEPITFCFISQEDNQRTANAQNSPFACNPLVRINGSFHIVYNKELLVGLNFTCAEIAGMVAHEIGHFVYGQLNVEKPSEIIQNEIRSDCFASRIGLASDLARALVKMSACITVYGFEERLESLSANCVFYRPNWTCGRSDIKRHVAICYNLISGEALYFKDEAAKVIALVLSTTRQDKVDIQDVSLKTEIASSQLCEFFCLLANYGILTTCPPTKDIELGYRQVISQNRKLNGSSVCSNVDSSMSKSNAELDYFEAVKAPDTITSVMFELTYRCSERCIHCYNPGATRNEAEISTRNRFQELTLEDYKRIIDDLYDHGLVKACITGGDPFANKDSWSILHYLYEKGIATDVYTNGQAIYKDAAKLASLYPRTVGISVYGSTAKVHDMVTRIPGSWKKSMSLIRELSDLGVPLNIKCCIMKPNFKDYRGIISIARETGAQPQFELNIRESNDGDVCANRLRLGEDELKVILMDKNIPYNLPDDLDSYKTRVCNLELNTCMIGIDDFSINPSGEVQPCVAFPMSFGNLKTHTWAELTKDNPLLDDWRNCTMKEYDKCGKYEYCCCCKPCAGLNFIEHGDFRKAAEASCDMARIRYSLLDRMSMGEDLLEGKDIDSALLSLPDSPKMNLCQHFRDRVKHQP